MKVGVTRTSVVCLRQLRLNSEASIPQGSLHKISVVRVVNKLDAHENSTIILFLNYI